MSLAGLIYILFIEIPLSPQFRKTKKREVISHGSYSIVRHPGFYPFLFLLISLSLITGNRVFIINAVYLVFLDFLLILIEDLIIFPRIFSNYRDYKKKVSFLLPKIKFGGS